MRGFSRLLLLIILGLLTAGTLGGLFLWPSIRELIVR